MVENSKIMRRAWCDNCNKEVRAYEIDMEWHCNNCHNHVDIICPNDKLPCTPDDCPYIYDCDPATVSQQKREGGSGQIRSENTQRSNDPYGGVHRPAT